MAKKILILGVVLFFSRSAFALDLEREQLLNLYHDVETIQQIPSQEWVNLSAGIAPNYQAQDEQIEFKPLPEKRTKFGIFTHETLEEEIAKQRVYKFTTPTQFGHAENESYGVYMKKTF